MAGSARRKGLSALFGAPISCGKLASVWRAKCSYEHQPRRTGATQTDWEEPQNGEESVEEGQETGWREVPRWLQEPARRTDGQLVGFTRSILRGRPKWGGPFVLILLNSSPLGQTPTPNTLLLREVPVEGLPGRGGQRFLPSARKSPFSTATVAAEPLCFDGPILDLHPPHLAAGMQYHSYTMWDGERRLRELLQSRVSLRPQPPKGCCHPPGSGLFLFLKGHGSTRRMTSSLVP